MSKGQQGALVAPKRLEKRRSAPRTALRYVNGDWLVSCVYVLVLVTLENYKERV